MRQPDKIPRKPFEILPTVSSLMDCLFWRDPRDPYLLAWLKGEINSMPVPIRDAWAAENKRRRIMEEESLTSRRNSTE